MADPMDLPQLREAIEQVDRELLLNLRKRMELVEGVARAKVLGAIPLRDPPREEHVLRRVRQSAAELGLDPHQIERLYRLIMEMSVSRQQEWIHGLESAPLRVAYQGVEGSFSHLAAQARYSGRKGGALLTGYESLREAAESVRSGAADLALIPIENTTAGSMNETYDLLAEGSLSITAEVVAQIEHRLLMLPGSKLEQLRTVLSHPQALAQCEPFLRTVPWIRPQAEFDTAGAARKVSQSNDPTMAAIASESAGRRFGLEVLPRSIQGDRGHYTRYVQVALEAGPIQPSIACKTSLLVVLDNQAGTLGEVLTLFARHRVSLSKIESRPIPGEPWKYRFYLDVEGHSASKELGDALEQVRPLTSTLRILGSYPKEESVG
jgi:chorismate mutase/prephenate dehydratase